MLYIVEFLVAVLLLVGAVLFGIYALSKILCLVLAVALAVWLVRIRAAEGIWIVGGGFAVTAGICAVVSML